MTRAHTADYSGVLHQLSAAEDANLAEREVPAGDGTVRKVAGVPKKLGRLYRRGKVEATGYDKDNHTVRMAVSSSAPVDRYFGQEILSHEKGALRTDRLKNGIALLFNHNLDHHLGRSADFELGDPLHVTSRFGGNPLALEKEGDVETGILTDVSIGYLVHEWEITEDKNGVRTYLAVDWEIYEVSLVTVPADPTVGVGRDAEPVKVRSFRSAKDADDDDDDDDEDGEETDPEDDDENDTGSASSRTTNPTQQRTTTMPPETTNNTPAAAGTDHAAENKTRIAGLRQLRTQYKDAFTEDALMAAVENGTSVEAARVLVADGIIAASQRHNVPTASEELFGEMSEREKGRYSLRNAYIAAAETTRRGTFTGKEYDAGFEREVSAALVKKASERGISDFRGGIVIPGAASRSLLGPQQRAISVTGTGAATVPTVLEPTPIELLRARTVVLAAGAQMMSGVRGGNFRIPRQSGAASSNWLAEQAGATESDVTFDSITMSPHRLQMWNAYTYDMLAQSPLAIDSILAEDRMRVLAVSLDYACLNGPTGGQSPVGLLYQTGLALIIAGSTRANSGVVTPGAGGVPITFVDVNNMEAAIAGANADIGAMCWAGRPKLRASMRSIPQIPGSAVSGFIMPNSKVGPNGRQEGPLGYDAIFSTNVPTGYTYNSVSNLDAFILGVWSQMLIADWDVSELIVDPYTGAADAVININEFAYYDTNVRHVPAFAACTSVLPS